MEEKILEETVKAETEVVKAAFEISPVLGFAVGFACGAVTTLGVIGIMSKGKKILKKRNKAEETVEVSEEDIDINQE